MGSHGEVGAQKFKLLPLRHATDLAFGQLFRGTRALAIKRDDRVLLLVSNLGLSILFFDEQKNFSMNRTFQVAAPILN